MIKISGTEIYSEKKLLRIIDTSKLISMGYHSDKIISEIRKFYLDSGYALVKIYVIENTPKLLSVYIDEGKLDRIVFHKLNSIITVKMRYTYTFKKNIYNEKRLDEIITAIRGKEGYDIIRQSLVPSRSFDDSFFQLDRELKLPVIGLQHLPFFATYRSRYYLDFHLGKSSEGEDGEKELVDYGLKTSYSKGFIPLVRYIRTGILAENDRIKSEVSAGIMYGFDRKFNEYPRMTFFEIDSSYLFTPLLYDFFTPLVKNMIYRSKASRKDLGLLTYDYWLIKSVLAPGLSILKKLELYSGLGLEDSIIMNSKLDPDSVRHAEIATGKNNYPFIESGLALSKYPINVLSQVKQKIDLTYNHYFYIKKFDELELKGIYDYEFKTNDLLSVKFTYKKEWGDIPFYHEEPVTSMVFKGFMGESFYSRHIFSLSTEILTSVLREYMYLGIYFDMVQFRGSGYDLMGTQRGIAGGPAFKTLVMDHFEIYIYNGWDLLFSTKHSGFNVNFGINKKW